MHRRHVLHGLAATALCALAGARPALGVPQQSQPVIPILMFHKVDDRPRFPEDISTSQLTVLFDTLWRQGFRPVNMSDILEHRVDAQVPAGCMSIGITADDAHRSIVFSRRDSRHEEQRNATSFVDIFASTLRPYGGAPRATFFISGVGDDRYSKEAGGYFGNVRPLAAVLDRLASMPGLELAYHTRTHVRMQNMDAAQTRALLEDQMRHFEQLGVLGRIRRILAYPYGVPPSPQGVRELAQMGFIGAVRAYPGINEARYTTLPQCVYDGRLVSDAFHLPRVCIGAYTYAAKTSAQAGSYVPIDPLEDFRKDVLDAPGARYVSRGPGLTPR